MASNCRMWKKGIVANFQVLSQNFARATAENQGSIWVRIADIRVEMWTHSVVLNVSVFHYHRMEQSSPLTVHCSGPPPVFNIQEPIESISLSSELLNSWKRRGASGRRGGASWPICCWKCLSRHHALLCFDCALSDGILCHQCVVT
jgi:hypothetical protein